MMLITIFTLVMTLQQALVKYQIVLQNRQTKMRHDQSDLMWMCGKELRRARFRNQEIGVDEGRHDRAAPHEP